MPISVDPFKGSSRLNADLDADGDGTITAEEWEAERATRGFVGMDRATTKHSLAQDYPGATVKNCIGPQSPHVHNTTYTNIKLPPNPPENPENKKLWAGVNHAEPTAADLFEQQLAQQGK